MVPQSTDLYGFGSLLRMLHVVLAVVAVAALTTELTICKTVAVAEEDISNQSWSTQHQVFLQKHSHFKREHTRVEN